MASVTNTSSSNPINWYDPKSGSTTAASNQNTTSSNSASGSSAMASQSAFLQLLVAQLKNQDPTQPADGMQFVTQLAQFSTLEQNLAMRNDLDSINSKMTSTTSAAAGNSSKSGTGSSSAV